MARRSTARRGGASQEDAAMADADDPYAPDGSVPQGPGGSARRPRAGAGGRWWVWVGRAVLWAFILVVLANGIWMPLRAGLAQPPAEEEPAETSESSFPNTAAAAFAVRFADTYLNAADDADTTRADALAEFVPEGEAAAFDRFGDTFSGSNLGVVAIDAEDDNNAVVTLTADIGGETMRLDIPVYAADDGTSLVVSGRPALLAAPGKARLPEGASVETDPEVRDALEPILHNFFEAYAETPDHLSRYVESGARITELPAGTLQLGELADITVPQDTAGADDGGRPVLATVVWHLDGGDADTSPGLTQNYRLTVVEDGGDWYVRDIRGAPQSFGDQ